MLLHHETRASNNNQQQQHKKNMHGQAKQKQEKFHEQLQSESVSSILLLQSEQRHL